MIKATLLGILVLGWLTLPAIAFVSKIRATDTTKLPCHQIAALYRGYVEGKLTAAQALTRLETFCQCSMAGQDLTDLTNFQDVLDTTTVPDLGASAAANTAEALLLQLEKLRKVHDMELGCALFEVNDDAVLSETEFRAYLGIP